MLLQRDGSSHLVLLWISVSRGEQELIPGLWRVQGLGWKHSRNIPSLLGRLHPSPWIQPRTIHHPREPSLHPSDALQTHSKSPSSPPTPQPALLSLGSNRNPVFHVKNSFPYKHPHHPALSPPGNFGCYGAAAPPGHQRLRVWRMSQHVEVHP